jgi:hypothetical protein
MSDPATQMSGEVERVPDFLRLGKVPVNYLQQLETDLLDPVVFQEGSGATVDGFCRFTLQPKGFLHSHSKLFVSLIPNANVSQAIFPANIGVGSVIKKAVLKVGNKVINEISDWDYLHALKSAHISNENNVERELYTTGRYINHEFVYDAGDNEEADTYSLDVGRNIDGTDVKMLPFADMDGNTAATQAESPTYAIDLSDLFPFLKVHQLPLYMITEPINIELTFRPPQDNRVVKITGSANQSFLIDRNELKFCADYIFYGSGDEMARYAEQNKSMSFSFTDHRMISTSVTQASLQSDTVRNIGMASRQVNKVITMFNPARANEASLLSGVSARGSTVGGAGNDVNKVEGLSYNLRYNDKFEFSSNVTNTARLFNLLQDTEGVIFVTRDEYNSGGGGIDAAITFAGRDQQADLRGSFFYNATRLTGGRVGTRGIEVHVKFDSIDADVTTMRSFCEYLRVAQLQDGEFTIFNV